MEQFPLLEHTSNDTGRILLYHIQQGDTDFSKYYLYKTAHLPGGQSEINVLLMCDDLEWLQGQILRQGFFRFPDNPNDDPRIMGVFI
jgi:hypothetical protein